MSRYAFIGLVLAASFVAPSVAPSFSSFECANDYCQPVFPSGLTGSFDFVVSFDPTISNPTLTNDGKNSLTSAAIEAANQWNYQLQVRNSSVRANYKTGGAGPGDLKVFVTSAESGHSAHHDPGPPILVTMAPDYGRTQGEGGFDWSFKVAVLMHEFGHQLGSSGVQDPETTCAGLSNMSPQEPSEWRWFTECDAEKFTSMIGPIRYDEDDDGYWTPPDDCDDYDPFAYPDGPTECTEDYLRDSDRDCTAVIDMYEYGACPYSPILLDLEGNGFTLTDRANGVVFDLDADGSPGQVPWTAIGADDAWLVLDRNANGLIDDGMELFGNFTVQPASSILNGFAALAVFDAVQDGGNGDGWIDAADAVFEKLRLWQDANHDGISDPTELFGLASKGVARLSLQYRSSLRADEYGNWFRFHARVVGARGADLGPRAIDVFLGASPPGPALQRGNSGRGRGSGS